MHQSPLPPGEGWGEGVSNEPLTAHPSISPLQEEEGLGSGNSHFGSSLVSPTLESGIQRFYQAAIGVMDA